MPHKIIVWIQWDNPCQTVIWTSNNVSYFYYGTKDLKFHSLLLRFLGICPRPWTIPLSSGSCGKNLQITSRHLSDIWILPQEREWWGGSLQESNGVCAPGWAGRPVGDLTGTALENADCLQAHQTERGEKKRRERMAQAPELPAPAHSSMTDPY